MVGAPWKIKSIYIHLSKRGICITMETMKTQCLLSSHSFTLPQLIYKCLPSVVSMPSTDLSVEFVVGQGKSGSGFNTCWGHSSWLVQVLLKPRRACEYCVRTETSGQ